MVGVISLRYQLWMDVFTENNIDPDFYTRGRSFEEILPWSHLNSGV